MSSIHGRFGHEAGRRAALSTDRILADNRRLAFLRELNHATAGTAILPEDETRLLRECLPRVQHPLFTDTERETIDGLERKYGGRLPAWRDQNRVLKGT